jgi:membrane protein
MNIVNLKRKFFEFFSRDLWEIELTSLNRYKSFVVKSLRLLNVAVNEFREGQLTLRAMSLVYTTLLSIVPLLALSFSILKAFGVHNQVVEPFLLKFLEPLGSKGEEITQKIMEFISNVKAGILGSLGLGLLIYTVISVIQKVEAAFNSIWRIEKPRTFIRKFSDYLSILLIGPVFIFSAFGLIASFMSSTFVRKILSIELFGDFFYYAVKILPYLIVCGVFTFLYIFIPNTKVRFRSALTGGILAGFLWETAGLVFASFIVSSAKYAAIYSGFAILIMFMIWLYLSWLILLIGAMVSFYHQYPHSLSIKKEVFKLSSRLRERLAFLIMYLIGYNYYHNQQPWTFHALAERLDLPVEPIHEVITLLERNSLIVKTANDPPTYLPAKDIETITLKELIDTVRVADSTTFSIEKHIVSVPEIEDVLETVDKAITSSLGGKTLKDIVRT